MSTSHNRRAAVAGVGTALVTGLGLASCTIPTDDPAPEEPSTTQTSHREAVGPKPTRSSSPTEKKGSGSSGTPGKPAGDAPVSQEELQQVVSEVAGQFGAKVGVAIGAGGGVVQAGSLQGQVEPAWSTIKVPLAIAALRKNPGEEQTAAQAIQVSDNAAAEQLWNSLGGGGAAAGEVAAVIRELSGQDVSVQPEVTRPGFSAFGQTRWGLNQQAQFVAGLASSAGDPAVGKVYELMGQVTPGQAYGLGQFAGAAFKGGWGPDESGGYLVRQFGTVPAGAIGGAGDSGAAVPIAIAAQAADGSYETGQQVLNALVERLGG